jgi:hypothetical protein
VKPLRADAQQNRDRLLAVLLDLLMDGLRYRPPA